jgi:hypothetical protein
MSCRDPDNGKPYMDRNSVSCGCEIDSPRSCGSVTKSTMLTFRFTDFSPVYPWLKLDNYMSFELRKR